MNKYIIVGGVPFTGYTGTTTYTAIKPVGTANTVKKCNNLTRKLYEKCGGLLVVVDAQTGELARAS